MPNNVLSSIYNIVEYGSFDLSTYATSSQIRINSVGERLEYFIKDSIVNSFHVVGENQKKKSHEAICSWIGNQNFPPDIMIRGGDAFEIKKSIGLTNQIQLNSAHPKNVLHKDDPRLTSHARECERDWTEKDIFYVMGQVKNRTINHLFYIQGKCYAADREIYQKIEKIVSTATQEYNGIVPNEKNKLISLLGVGEYIANATLCFVFDIALPIIDVNTRRVFSRAFEWKMADEKMHIKIQKMMPQHNFKDFNWAVIDFSSKICSRKPKCFSCFAHSYCAHRLYSDR